MVAFDLAIPHRLKGDYAAAFHHDLDTLQRRRVALPADHPYTLGAATHLALEMWAESKFRESVELLRATMDTYREVLGRTRSESLRTAPCLAMSLSEASDYAEAMELAQNTYDRFEETDSTVSRRRHVPARATWPMAMGPTATFRRRST